MVDMADMAEVCEGGCGCGAVRYRVASPPLIVHACHCRLCQRQTGSTNALNALIEADRVTVTQGAVEALTLPTPSGKGQRITRCPDCRIALWSNYLINGLGESLLFLRVGTLDNPDLMPPDVHIHTASKVPWYVIPEGHRAVPVFYDRATTLSRESQDRLAALTEKHRAGTT